MKYILVLMLGVALFFSCKYLGGKRVRGDGNLVTQQRDVSSFDEVESYGSMEVEVTGGNESSVRVEAEENLQKYIEIIVEDGTLKIKTRRNYNLDPERDIKVFVTSPSYSSLSSSGSGNITGRNALSSSKPVKLSLAGSGNISVEMTAPSLTGEIAGSGNINLSGTVREFSSSIMGSGSIRAKNLNVEEAKVEIAGSGDVEIAASEKLDVHIMGSGDVRYRGDAHVNSTIAGSGSVIKMD
jgi:hypothetical protein